MGVGIPFRISVGAEVQVWQAISDVEGKLISIIGGDDLPVDVDATGAVIDMVDMSLELSGGDDRWTAHHSSKLVEDCDDRAMMPGDSVGTARDNWYVHELVSVNTFNVDKAISRASDDAAVRSC
jgi:hypothetical protein